MIRTPALPSHLHLMQRPDARAVNYHVLYAVGCTLCRVYARPARPLSRSSFGVVLRRAVLFLFVLKPGLVASFQRGIHRASRAALTHRFGPPEPHL